MQLHGYAALAAEDKFGLLALREVTLTAPPGVLREIANYLWRMATLMEEGGFLDPDPRCIGEVVADWCRRFPNLNIAVCAPATFRGSDEPIRFRYTMAGLIKTEETP